MIVLSNYYLNTLGARGTFMFDLNLVKICRAWQKFRFGLNLYTSCFTSVDVSVCVMSKVLRYVQPQLMASSAWEWVWWISALSLSISTQVMKLPQSQALMLSAHWSLRNGLVTAQQESSAAPPLCVNSLYGQLQLYDCCLVRHTIASHDGPNELGSSYKCQLFLFGSKTNCFVV